ncbi:TPA: hypothetical protein I9Z29_000901 [Clostridium perfringens]|nr:hypothetical protein [Clostridium perfringens]
MNNNEIQKLNDIKFKEVLIVISKHKNYKELLNFIFENNIKYNNENLIYNVTSNLINIFKVDCNIIIDYLSGAYIRGDIELASEELEVLELLNNLKDKYSSILIKSINRARNPIGLSGVSANIGQSVSHNNITIFRNDEKMLDLLCTAQDLVHFTNSLNQALLNVLNVGIYNLEIDSINELMTNLNALNNKLNNMTNNG